MAEYIERAALMGALTAGAEQLSMREMSGAEAYNEFLALVNNTPAADVAEVVRCRECKYWKPSGGYAGDNINDLQRLGGCKWAVACVRENDF